MNRKLANYIVVFFGVGLARKFPGSLASFASMLLWYSSMLYIGVSTIIAMIINLAIFLVAYYSIKEYQKTSEESDPQEIVIDEVSGMSIAVLGSSIFFSSSYFLFAFMIFRVLDFFKPSIIYRFEIDKKDSSILMDDVLAGLITLLIMLALGSSNIV